MSEIMKILNIFLLAIVSSLNLFSDDCPDGSEPWTSDNIDHTFHRYGPLGSVDYKYRTVGNEIQLDIDWATLVDHNSWGESLLKKILLREIIDEMITGADGFYNVAFYYETPCKATVKTAVKVEKSFTPYCCDEGATMTNEIFDYGHQYFIRNVKKTVFCGYKCCKKVYEVERRTYWDSM